MDRTNEDLEKRHRQEIKLLEQTLYQEVLHLKLKQKSKFQEMVMHPERIPQKQIPIIPAREVTSGSKTTSLSRPSSANSFSTRFAEQRKAVVENPMIQEIVLMGFTPIQAKAALEMTNNDLVCLLFTFISSFLHTSNDLKLLLK